MIHPVLFTFIEEHKPLPKGVVCVLITEKKETVFVRLPSGSCNLEIGIGDYNQITLRQMRLIIRKIIQVAKIHRITSIAIKYSDLCFKNIPYSEEIVAELIAVNMEMANFEFVNYKTKPKEGWQAVKKVYVIGRLTKTVKNAFKKGSTIGIEVNASRSLSNTPGGEMTPRLL
jgi:leucyl aminopeptidase